MTNRIQKATDKKARLARRLSEDRLSYGPPKQKKEAPPLEPQRKEGIKAKRA